MFIVQWCTGYVHKNGLRRGYTRRTDEAKVWKTREAAERWIGLRSPGYATDCTIIEITPQEK